MNKTEAENNYNVLFPTTESKAEAFDAIARRFYLMNFGSMSKSDFDLLMFSLYIERLYETADTEKSDYSISKQLGITRARVSSFRVKKELVYPRENYNWRDEFRNLFVNAVVEDGKIKVYVPDAVLFGEIKNAVENNGGVIECKLTANLLQVNIAYFLDLAVETESDESKRKEIRKEIKKKISENTGIVAKDAAPSFGASLRDATPDILAGVISGCVPLFGDALGKVAKNIIESVKTKKSY